MYNIKKIPYQKYKNLSSSSYVAAYKNAKQKMMNRIKFVSQDKAKQLEIALNRLFKQAEETEEMRESLGNAIAQNLPWWTEKGKELGIEVNANLELRSVDLTLAKTELEKAEEDLKKVTTEFEKMELEQKIENLQKTIPKLEGQINKYKGDLLEGLLQLIGPYIVKKTAELTRDETNNLLAGISKELIDNPSTIETLGNKNAKTINYSIMGNKASISSQGKTDVIMQIPMFHNENLFVSAKNYSQSRDIHLVGGAVISGLVSQWLVNNNAKDYFLNSLTVWKTPQEVIEAGKFLFAIQGLSGARKAEIKSNVLIINIRDLVNPIRVISIPAVLQDIIENNSESDSFIFKFQPPPPWFNPFLPRTPDRFKEAMKTGKLSIELAKSRITLAYLNRLIKK